MKSNSKASTIDSSTKMFKPQVAAATTAPKATEEQLTPTNSSSSPYTITSSLSSSSCSLPVAVPMPPTSKPPSTKKSSINSSSSTSNNNKIVEKQSNKLNESASSSSSLSACSSHKCFISIWSIWYCLLVTALHIYLIKNRIVDIINLFSLNSDLFTLNNFNSHNYTNNNNNNNNNNNTLNMNELNASIYFEVVSRLCLLILSIVFLIMFLLCSLKPLGNYSNDGVKFGRDFFYEKIEHDHLSKSSVTKKRRRRSERSCLTSLIEVIWRHFLPANSFFHLVSILLLIFSSIVFDDSRKTMQTYSAIKSCLIPTTNKQWLTRSSSSTTCLHNFYDLQVNQSMTVFYNTDESNPNTFYFLEQIILYKFELISLCLTYVSIYIRYGSVFWFTNKSLSFLITFIGFIGAIEQLLQLYSFIYIYNQLNLNEKIYWFNYFSRENITNLSLKSNDLVESTNNKHSFLATFTDSFEFTFLIKNKFTLFFLYFTLSFLVYLSATPAYVFAFLKYKERFIIEESLFNRTILNKTNTNKKEDYSYSSSSTSSTSIDPMTNVRLQPTHTTCCFNYCPHLIATIQLVLICASKLPFCYDYVIYFNKYKDFGICLVIISEIMHTIILIFIWLLLTLKTEWTMHLQTSFSICHWTYHLKHRRSSNTSNEVAGNETPDKQPIHMLNGEEHGLKNANMNTQLENNLFINNDDNMKKSLDLNDYNHQARLNSGNKFSTLLTYKQQQQQHQLFEPTVMIRNNNANIYSSNKSRQKMLETKHKSLMDENTNIYNTNNNYNLDEEESSLRPGSGSDYLLNSETLYRNEIRKSIRNIMQQKRCNSTAMIGSSATLILNQQQQQQQQNNQEQIHKINEPFYFHTENGKKRLVSGVYLTSTTPTIIDNKLPTVTHIMTSTICSTTNQLDNQQNNNNNNKNRSVLYLERRTSASNEYESRV